LNPYSGPMLRKFEIAFTPSPSPLPPHGSLDLGLLQRSDVSATRAASVDNRPFPYSSPAPTHTSRPGRMCTLANSRCPLRNRRHPFPIAASAPRIASSWSHEANSGVRNPSGVGQKCTLSLQLPELHWMVRTILAALLRNFRLKTSTLSQTPQRSSVRTGHCVNFRVQPITCFAHLLDFGVPDAQRGGTCRLSLRHLFGGACIVTFEKVIE
jgi:hypothetical protein